MAGLADLFAPESYDPNAPVKPRSQHVPVKPKGELKKLDAGYYRDMPVMDKVSNIGRTLGQAVGYSPTLANRMGEEAQTGIGFVPGVGDALGAVEAKESLLAGDIGKGLLQAGLTAVGVVPGVGDLAAKAGREGLETVADTLSAATKAAPDVAAAPIRAYHGSPYDFDRFDASRIGTGESGTNSGRGLNFTDDEGEAYTYQRPDIRDNPFGESAFTGKPGHTYGVNINAKPDQFVDLDLPISQQPQAVQDAVREWSSTTSMGDQRKLSHYLRHDRDIEERLAAAGYKGLRAGMGRNVHHTVFDPSIIDITHKNGEPFTASPVADTMAAATRPSIKAYHGSPHSFDRFDMSKIGTGEGAQAYGHGLYFAENEGVAKSYRDTLAARTQGAGDAVSSAYKNVASDNGFLIVNGQNYSSPESIISDISKGYLKPDDLPDELAAAVREYTSPGSMYEVNIAADPEQFLDWDKPLSEQPQGVRDWYNKRVAPGLKTRPVGDVLTDVMHPEGGSLGVFTKDNLGDVLSNPAKYVPTRGEDIARGNEDVLKQAGIPGIKYLDAGSRGAADGGSYNYVVNDENLISIVRKYGIPAALGAGLITEEMARQMQDQGLGET